MGSSPPLRLAPQDPAHPALAQLHVAEDINDEDSELLQEVLSWDPRGPRVLSLSSKTVIDNTLLEPDLKKLFSEADLDEIVRRYWIGRQSSEKQVERRQRALELMARYKTSPYYISGVYSLYHVTSPQFNKNIWLFGERHDTTAGVRCTPKTGPGTTISAYRYIKTVLDSTTSFLDVFLERTLVPGLGVASSFLIPQDEAPKYRSNMHEVQRLVQACTSRWASTCQYPNLRVHLVDNRVGSCLSDPLTTLGDLLTILTNNSGGHIKSMGSLGFMSQQPVGTMVTETLRLLERFNDLQSPVDVIAWNNYVMVHCPRLVKQLEHFPNLSLAKQIMDATADQILGEATDLGALNAEVPELYGTLAANLREFQTVHGDKFTEIHEAIFDAFASLLSPAMDAYTILRMMRPYADRTPDDPYYIASHEGQTAVRNVLVYAGGAHTDLYEAVLAKLPSFTTTTITSDVPAVGGCIPLTGPLAEGLFP